MVHKIHLYSDITDLRCKQLINSQNWIIAKMYNYNALLTFVVGMSYCVCDFNIFVGDEVTITFNGPRLYFNIENPQLHDWKRFVLCFKSYPNTVREHCPRGYALFYSYVLGQARICYKMTRLGTIVDASASKMRGSVFFGNDGSVTIKVLQLPPSGYVRLINAQKVVPTTTTTTIPVRSTTTIPKTVKTTSYTVYYVIGGLVLLFILIVGSVIAWLCWSRKSRLSSPPH
uniref:Galectin n=1 Tax=Panagrellus redivivus TaxID=6233 RepID=A0A7E4V600_PANRE